MHEVRISATGCQTPDEHKLYSIRFHLMSGKHKDMHIDEYDREGRRNVLWNAVNVYKAVQSNLENYHKYNSKNDEIPSQNFTVYEDALEFLELIERDAT